MGFLAWIVVGGIAGWLAGQVMKGGGYGILVDIILGILGGVVDHAVGEESLTVENSFSLTVCIGTVPIPRRKRRQMPLRWSYVSLTWY
jgi:uncharacterized membrane protein YeaQ/YmgE (transglycosylase-associated protein family)